MLKPLLSRTTNYGLYVHVLLRMAMRTYDLLRYINADEVCAFKSGCQRVL